MTAVDNNQTDRARHVGDDLQEIYGIGPKLEEALRRIGVQTFAKLATYTPEDLSQALQEQAHMQMPARRIEAQNFLGQAARLAARQTQNPEASSDATVQMREPQNGVRKEAATDAGWRQHAGFSLFFDRSIDEQGVPVWETRIWKTHLYHNETGDEKTFSEAKPMAWVPWIMNQAQLPVRLEELVAPSVPPEDEPSEVQIEIKEVHGEKIAVEKPLATSMDADQIAVQVTFRIGGRDAERWMAQSALYQLDACIVSSRQKTLLQMTSVREHLRPGQHAYHNQIRLSLPPSGVYEIDVVIFLLPPSPHALVRHTVPLRIMPVFA